MLLKGKKGIISGALDENSIAWIVADRCFDEGAKFTLTNAPIALRMGKINELAEKCSSKVIAADLTSLEDIQNLYSESNVFLNGKVDFILHSVGMSPNVRKKKEYGDLNYDWLIKTLDISAISFHKMMQIAEKNQILNESQNSGYKGWDQFGSKNNRYWICENFLNPEFIDVREAYYNYHLLGMDMFYSKPEESQNIILENLSKINVVNSKNFNSSLINIFINSKVNEITNIFKDASLNIKRDAFNILNELSPSNSDLFNKILE